MGQTPSLRRRNWEGARAASLCAVMNGERTQAYIPCLGRYPRAGAVWRGARSPPAAVATRRCQAPVCCCRSRCRVCTDVDAWCARARACIRSCILYLVCTRTSMHKLQVALGTRVREVVWHNAPACVRMTDARTLDAPRAHVHVHMTGANT